MGFSRLEYRSGLPFPFPHGKRTFPGKVQGICVVKTRVDCQRLLQMLITFKKVQQIQHRMNILLIFFPFYLKINNSISLSLNVCVILMFCIFAVPPPSLMKKSILKFVRKYLT